MNLWSQGKSGEHSNEGDVHHDVSPPLRTLTNVPAAMQPEHEGELPIPSGAGYDAVQTSAIVTVQTVGQISFNGISATGYVAPDANGAVGPTQYVQWANNKIAVYSKSNGALLYGPVNTNTVWTGFGGPCATTNQNDGTVRYDRRAGRWLLFRPAFVSGGNAYYCTAVSSSSDATGTYYRYAFKTPSSYFPDYPKIAIWSDGYYISTNLLNQNNSYSFVGSQLCAQNRSQMLNGASATMQCFQPSTKFGSLLPSDLDGPTAPVAGTPNYVLGLDTNALDLWHFHVDWSTPSRSALSGPTLIKVASYTTACGSTQTVICIPQQATGQLLDSVGDRLMYRLTYRKFSSFDSLLATHTVATANGNTGIRWYEIRNPGGTPTVYQQGTFSPDNNYRWMPSIAADKRGDIAVGYSVSSKMMSPEIHYTGRVPSDPLGTMEAEKVIIDGAGSQTGNSRWGDYSGMSVDPSDDCTFWYTNEYYGADGTKNWRTRIAAFTFSGCQ